MTVRTKKLFTSAVLMFFAANSLVAQTGGGTTGINAATSTDNTSYQRANAPADKFTFESPIYKGLLKPLVYGKPTAHQTPKNALITTDTNTRNRQEPPQPISSLLIS